MMNVRKFIPLVLCGAVILLGIGFYFNQRSKNQTNTQPARYSFSEQKKTLEANYPEFSKTLKLENQSDMPAIPGLITTKTLKNNSNQAIGISHQMDPQGVVRVEDYLLISAYSHDHAYQSVLYVLDAKSRNYLKTIVLNGIPHVGGIAYDTQHKNIWLCSVSDEKKGQVAAIHLKTLEKYDFEKQVEPIKYDQIVDLGDIDEASFLTYHKKALYIGFFDKNHDGLLTRYDIDAKGLFDKDYGSTIKISSSENLSMPEKTYPIDSKIQGITFYGDKVLLSHSYGPKNSRLLVFNHGQNINLDTEAIYTLETPPYLEQIYAYNDTLYMVFESATSLYRKNDKITHVDHVLQLDLKKLPL